MLFDPKHEDYLGRLEEQLRCTQAITPELMSQVIAEACIRFAAHSGDSRARFSRLIEAGAWSDAAIALVELELPGCKLRRLAYEDGEWICSLSRQSNLPSQTDDTADAHHEVMALAILSAFLEARRRTEAEKNVQSTTVPQVRPVTGTAICCDNFA